MSSAASRWQVWSKDPSRPGWVVIDSGTEREAREGAERRKRTAERHGVEADYLALPRGQEPEG
jgi:hypothetical protein